MAVEEATSGISLCTPTSSFEFALRVCACNLLDPAHILAAAAAAAAVSAVSAFRAKSFQYHPDVNKGNEKDANAKFRQILDAYHTLRDPRKRAEYDRSIN